MGKKRKLLTLGDLRPGLDPGLTIQVEITDRFGNKALESCFAALLSVTESPNAESVVIEVALTSHRLQKDRNPGRKRDISGKATQIW